MVVGLVPKKTGGERILEKLRKVEWKLARKLISIEILKCEK